MSDSLRFSRKVVIDYNCSVSSDTEKKPINSLLGGSLKSLGCSFL